MFYKIEHLLYRYIQIYGNYFTLYVCSTVSKTITEDFIYAPASGKYYLDCTMLYFCHHHIILYEDLDRMTQNKSIKAQLCT